MLLERAEYPIFTNRVPRPDLGHRRVTSQHAVPASRQVFSAVSGTGPPANIDRLKVPVALHATVAAIVAVTDVFCEPHLDDEYDEFCRALSPASVAKHGAVLLRVKGRGSG